MPSERLERLSTAFTGILVICALGVTGTVLQREYFPRGQRGPPAEQPPLDVGRQWAELTASGHRIGPASAPIQIVEFSDFQCPYCAALQAQIRAVRLGRPDSVAILFRHFPLATIHPYARAAALAASCADAQGRFEPLHDLLFNQQDSIGVKSWEAFAREAGVPDVRGFTKCHASQRFERDLERDVRLGQRIGIMGTPTLIIRGRMLRSALTVEIIERSLKEAAPTGAVLR